MAGYKQAALIWQVVVWFSHLSQLLWEGLHFKLSWSEALLLTTTATPHLWCSDLTVPRNTADVDLQGPQRLSWRRRRAGEWNPRGDVIRGLALRWFSCLYQEAAQPPPPSPWEAEKAHLFWMQVQTAGVQCRGYGGQGCTHISWNGGTKMSHGAARAVVCSVSSSLPASSFLMQEGLGVGFLDPPELCHRGELDGVRASGPGGLKACAWRLCTPTHLCPQWNTVLLLLFSHSVVPDSLRPHGLQHTRLPCPSPSPRACSNSWPLSWWYHPTILSSVIPFSTCPQSFPASGSFPVS